MNDEPKTKLDLASRTEPVERVTGPLRRFARLESAGGVVLLASTVVALGWANSPFAGSYHDFFHVPIAIRVGSAEIAHSLGHWINDGLMVVFFFLVGLEIKRELLVGELASVRQATLPIMAAVGGMVVPASIYAAFNAGTPEASGWGIPMATDIAFALGVLALLGARAPAGLTAFLAALAIVDDIGAVLVIALFYTASVSLAWLAVAAGALALMVLMGRLGVRSPLAYAVPGIITWLAFLFSGVHATMAGVLAAMTIPVRTRLDPDRFLASSGEILDYFDRAAATAQDAPVLVNERRQAAVAALEHACERVQTPLQRLEHGLAPWVTFAILPLFALGNAGVSLGGDLLATLSEPVSLGIIAGLIPGKVAGIALFSWLAVRLGLSRLPAGVRWPHIVGAGLLGGIGFTMSLFIGMLAFPEGAAIETAKAAVLAASIASGVAGWLVLRRAAPPTPVTTS